MEKTPVSFDVFAVSPQGYEVHFQLNGEKVYEGAVKLLAALNKDGFMPKMMYQGSPKGNGNGAGKGAQKLCPLHKTPMQLYENGNGAWFSHGLDDGNWCRGKAS